MVKNIYLEGTNLSIEGKDCNRITFIIKGNVNILIKDLD